MLGALLLILAVVLVIGLGYVGLEVALYLNWATNRGSSQSKDFSTYAQENEGGLIARYCG